MRALTQERPLRRDQDTNWGDRTRIGSGKPKTLAWVSLAASRSLLVYASARLLKGTAPSTVPIVTVEWGHGGASIAHDFPVVHRLRVPLAASMVKLSARLEDGSGKPASASALADVAAFIAEGSDGETMRNTAWVSQTGFEGTVAEGPQRVMRVEGLSADSVDRYVMLFDKRPHDGDYPLLCAPAPAKQRFDVPRYDSQAFPGGVYWAASDNPLNLKTATAAALRVDVELLL